MFSGQEEGGGQGGWLVPKPGNKSTPQPSLSIQLGLLMGTQGARGEQATFPGRVRKCPCAGPTPPCRLWGPILEASSGCFLALSAPRLHCSRTPGAHSPRAACSSLSAQPLRPRPTVDETRARQVLTVYREESPISSPRTHSYPSHHVRRTKPWIFVYNLINLHNYLLSWKD